MQAPSAQAPAGEQTRHPESEDQQQDRDAGKEREQRLPDLPHVICLQRDRDRRPDAPYSVNACPMTAAMPSMSSRACAP